MGNWVVNSFVVLSTKLYKKSRTCNFGFIFYFLLFTKYRSFKWVPGCIYFLPYSLTEDKGWNSVLSVAFRNFWVYKCANIEEEKTRVKYVTSDNITHSLNKWNLGMKWKKIARKKLSPPIEWTNEPTSKQCNVHSKKAYVNFYGATWRLPKYNLWN